MRAVVLFINIGFYHAARLRAAFDVFKDIGWQLTAIQLTDSTHEHPWGNTESIISFPLVTLIPAVSSRKGATQLPDVPTDDLERYLTELNPDVVFLPGWSFSLAAIALRWCRRNKVSTVVMSDSKQDDQKRTWWKERLKSLLFVRKYSAALVAGSVHADYMESLGLPRVRIFTGYDAVDNDHFSHAADIARSDIVTSRKQCPSIPDRPYFLVVTRLIPRKNVARLLEAYDLYRNIVSGTPWDLVVCGHGVEKARLEETVRIKGLDEFVHFPGFVSYHDVGYWYGLAGAFAHPATSEQWGLVVNEACAAGLPIVCSRTVGARYDLVRDGVNGFIFDPESINDIAQCLLRIHETPSNMRKQMGDESRQLVKLCSPQVFATNAIAAARVATEIAQTEQFSSVSRGRLQMYTQGEYSEKNPNWHAKDSPWKASQILKMIERNNLFPHSISEIGCGAGEILNQLSIKLPLPEFVGYEISPQAFQLCKQKNNPRIKYLLEDLLEDQSAKFDLVLAIDVIEHVEDIFAFLKKLRNKGEYKIFHIPLDLSVQSILRKTPILKARTDVGHIHYFTKELAMAMLIDNGYQIVDIFYTPSSVDLTAPSKTSFLAKFPRKLMFWINQDLTVRIFGGYSLMVLTR